MRPALKNNQFVTHNLVTFPTPSTAFFQLSFPLSLSLNPPLTPLRLFDFQSLKRGRETTYFLSPRKLFLKLFSARFPHRFFSPFQSLDRRAVKVATSSPTASGISKKSLNPFFNPEH